MVDYWRLFRTWGRLRSFPHRDVEDIRCYQLRRFKKLLEQTYTHVPMYRKFYDDNGFHPSAVKRYEDIDLVPILTKSFIRNFSIRERVAQWSLDSKVLKETTSGSTGEPTEIWSDQTEGLIQTLKGIRSLREWGYSIFDNIVQVWRVDVAPKQSIVQRFGIFRRELVPIMDDPDVKVKRVMRNRCDVLMGTRSTLEILAEELSEREITVHPRILVSTSEVVTDEHRKLFKDVYGCELLELYGCAETGTIAWACPEIPENLHLEMETVMVNYIDERVGESGQRIASLALTNLNNAVMPFIRFDPGDEVLLPARTECGCGRTLPIIGRIRGRYDDIIEHRGRRLNWHFFYNYFKNYLYINKYKVVETKAGNINFKVQLVNDDEDNRRRCISDLNAAFRQYIAPIEVNFVDHFAVVRTGKFKVIEKEA